MQKNSGAITAQELMDSIQSPTVKALLEIGEHQRQNRLNKSSLKQYEQVWNAFQEHVSLLENGRTESLDGSPDQAASHVWAYIVKDQNDGHTANNAWKIYSALRFWYGEKLSKNADWGCSNANPCNSPTLCQYMRGLRKQEERAGNKVKRAVPIRAKHLRQIYKFLHSLEGQALYSKAEVAFIMMTFTLAFQLWLRVDSEMLTMKWQQISLEFWEGDQEKEYFCIELGWRKSPNGRGNVYQIFPCPQTPELDLFHWLKEWKRIVVSLGDSVGPSPNHPVVAALSRNKAKEVVIDPAAPISSRSFLILINRVFSDAGITGIHFTTHSFRRGAAQHYFIMATPRWSLASVKWWGGWSQSDDVSVVIRYLLEEEYEENQYFGDMLNPYRRADRHAFSEVEQPSAPHGDMQIVLQELGELKEMVKSSATPPPQPPLLISEPPAMSQPSNEPQPKRQRHSVRAHTIGRVKTVRDVLRQYNQGGADCVPPKPLKEWLPGEINVSRAIAALYSQRKVIGEAFDIVGEAGFEDIMGLPVGVARTRCQDIIRAHQQ
eukprot:GCRY01001105.1.p1 GENE.GCRY01001105.1~~GCRY01001105.1.p1  ORF type:complete len:547 (-),score=98.80 GCRY01001105.1:516-2156(-)